MADPTSRDLIKECDDLRAQIGRGIPVDPQVLSELLWAVRNRMDESKHIIRLLRYR